MGNFFYGENESNDLNEIFYLKNNKVFPLTSKCIICKNQRFTPEQIKILSDENLTREIFDQNFDFKLVNESVCHDLHCRIRYRSKTQTGLNDYDIDFILGFLNQ